MILDDGSLLATPIVLAVLRAVRGTGLSEGASTRAMAIALRPPADTPASKAAKPK